MPRHKERIVHKPKVFPPMMDMVAGGGGIVPKTEFGCELLALRNKAIASGMKLRGAEEILSEIEESRRPL